MKKFAAMMAALCALAFAGCSGPGGPATRAGRAADNVVYHVGHGVKHAGQAIENAATGD